MGEVYQAKDQFLGREVAIKVLPDEFAKDADRVARFQREAKVLASLNHPNSAAIHELEQSEGKNFLVLELVEGQTLADRIKTGPIPVEESLKLALQIAEALEAAYEKGIIHRDLKPSNIKVTPEGKARCSTLAWRRHLSTLKDGTVSSAKETFPVNGGVFKVLQTAPAAGESEIETMLEPGNRFLTSMKDGKQIAIRRLVISKDGNRMSITIKSTDAKGTPFESVLIYDKQ